MTELYLLRLIPIAAVLLAFWLLMWHFWGGNRKKAVENLKKHFQEKICPREELAGVLRDTEQEKKRQLQLRDLTALHITPEQEMRSAYYARTSQLVCDGRRKGGETDSWYQEADWIRDILAGRPMQRAEMKPVENKRR